MALVKYNNNSISAVSSVASMPSGALVPIKTLTASGSSSLAFVHGSSSVVFDSTYPIYVFKFINIHPANDGGEFEFNISTDSGSNYNVVKTTTFFKALHKEDDSAASLTYDTVYHVTQATSDAYLTRRTGGDSDQSNSGIMHFFNPSSDTFVKHFISTVNLAEKDNQTMECFVGGYGNTTSAINAIRFQFSNGNIESGKIKLFGIKDS